MKITLNGKETEIEPAITLQELLSHLKMTPELVACELNLQIVKRSQYAHTALSEGDQLEILQMIGGG
jgi:sulfur carrier protein